VTSKIETVSDALAGVTGRANEIDQIAVAWSEFISSI